MRSNTLLFVLFLCVGTLTAQINIGFRTGILRCSSVQSPAEENAPSFQRISALQAAIPIEISLGKSFAIQPEIMYGALGSKFEILNKSEPGSVAGTNTDKSRRIGVGAGIMVPIR